MPDRRDLTVRKGLIFIISGPAGSGKGTVVNIIRSRTSNVGVSVSATTRSPRPGEADGVSYHFISREKFEELLGGLVYKPKGKPVLVSDDDKRPEYSNVTIDDLNDK